VTEAEWLACTDIYSMLEFLYGRASEWKLRLFGCAALRRIWSFLSDERAIHAVEIAEQFADGQASAEGLAGATHGASVATVDIHYQGDASLSPGRSGGHTRNESTPHWFAAMAAAVASRDGRGAAGGGSEETAHAVASTWHRDGDAIWRKRKQRELRGQVPFGSRYLQPFGGPRPACLASSSRAVESLARAAYDDRWLPAGTLEPARLSLRAEAVEDAGCTHADLLGHLRGV
jgi:hypothetical protein